MNSNAFEYFPDPVHVRVTVDSRHRKLISPLRYFMAPGADPITVPAGFLTDYASIPRLFWPALPSWGKYGPAAIVHDYLYARDGMRIPDPEAPEKYTENSRKTADTIFLLAMKHLGVPLIKRQVMYWAVRVFGGSAYKTA